MSDRQPRESTLKRTEESRKNLVEREALASRKKDFGEEVRRLSLLVEESCRKETDLEWDHSFDKESPKKSEHELEDYEEVFEDTCDIQVDLPDPIVDGAGVATFGSSTRSASVGVNRVEIGDLEALTPGWQAYRPFRILLPSVAEEDSMEGHEFTEAVKVVRLLARKSNDAMENYEVEDAVDADPVEHKSMMDSMERATAEMLAKANLIYEAAPAPSLEQVAIVQEIVEKVKSDKKALQREIRAARKLQPGQPPVPVPDVHGGEQLQAERDHRARTEKRARALLKVEQVGDKCDTLYPKVNTLKDPSEMLDSEVREGITDSKEWQKELQCIVQSKEKAQEEAIGVDIDTEEMVASVAHIKNTVNDMVVKLKTEDKKRGLYTLTASRSKDTVIFPPPFSGKCGEDVYTFRKEFEEALLGNQVREVDKVKTLRKYLVGEAKQKIGDHYIDVSVALTSLIDYFGNPRMIWEKEVEAFQRSVSDPKKDWGVSGSQQRVFAIAQTLEFLRKSKKMAERFIELRAEIFSSNTTRLLFKVIPRNYMEHICDQIDNVSATEQEKMLKIEEYLEKKKTSALLAVQSHTEPADVKKKEERYAAPPPYQQRSQANGRPSAASVRQVRDCCNSRACVKKFGFLGCVETYQLATVRERRHFIFQAGNCMQCGDSYEKGHKCNWFKEKMNVVMCTEKTSNNRACMNGAATCRDHETVPNAPRELLDWLRRSRIKSTVFTVRCTPVSRSFPGPAQATRSRKFTPQQSMDLTQSGELVMVQSDAELEIHLAEKLENQSKKHSQVRKGPVNPLPHGQGMFVFCMFKGKTRAVQAFIDTGCDGWLAADGIPENELVSCRLSDGPIPLTIASGLTINATAEWGSLIPLDDGSHQVVRGITLPKVTGDMPKLELETIFKKIQKQVPGNEVLQSMAIPPVLGMSVDMILGQRFAKIHPEPIHILPSGLTIFRSRLLPAKPGQVACIGGPLGALECLARNHHHKGIMLQLARMCNNLSSFRPKVEFFPLMRDEYVDVEIPGVETKEYKLESFDNEESQTYQKGGPGPAGDGGDQSGLWGDEAEIVSTVSSPCNPRPLVVGVTRGGPELGPSNDPAGPKINQTKVDQEELHADKKGDFVDCMDCKQPQLIAAAVSTIKKEHKDWLKMQELGLDTGYRCKACRDCADCRKGSGHERISMHQEAENQMIQASVYIDKDKKQAFAKLPFIDNPEETLTDNKYIAIKRLDNVLRKYCSSGDIKDELTEAFQKLEANGHLVRLDLLTNQQQKHINTGNVRYYIPWDVQFKDSISTPVRPVFDASSTTPGGASLNTIVAKGEPDLVRLLSILLDFTMGPCAVAGDISQFYPSINLHEDDWKFQLVLTRDGMDPAGKLIVNVMRKLIYGVKCVSAQSEEIVRQLAHSLSGQYPNVANFLLKSRYCDDLAKSFKTKSEAKVMALQVEDALGSINMKLKGWAVSGEDPPENLTKDGASVSMCGISWFPKGDFYKLGIPALHFGKKKRGRLPDTVPIYDGQVSIEDFTPANLTRRMSTSVAARVWDPCGKLAPMMTKFKYDLRRIIKEDPDWDKPLTDTMRNLMINNFKQLMELKDLFYIRSPIPQDALRLTARLIVLGDAAQPAMMTGAYVCYERPNGAWSCDHIFGRGILGDEDRPLPQRELQALSNAADMLGLLANNISDWIESVVVGSDSEIALAWASYEKTKLHVFHQNRVINIRRHVSMDNLYWVQGSEMPVDTGTRPDLVTAQMMAPGSLYLSGAPWMRMSMPQAEAEGFVKSVGTIKLDNDSKKVVKQGEIFDSFQSIKDEDCFAMIVVQAVNIDKMLQQEEKAMYLYSPLKRRFSSLLRITALVLRAVRRFLLRWKAKKISDEDLNNEELNKYKVKPARFSVFHAHKPDSGDRIELSDDEMSGALEHLYRKATIELKQFNSKDTVNRIGVEQDGIIFSRTRLLEGGQVKVMGELSDLLRAEDFTGINNKVPLLDRHSSLALSIAMHLHYKVYKHKEPEALYRLSQAYVKILGGRQLFREIAQDCVKCKKLEKKLVEQLMGPLADSQTSISPIFYVTYVDLWGPVRIFCPGYEKVTRSHSQTKPYDSYMMVMVCAATGTVNCQMIEGKNTGAVMDGFQRLFCEVAIPKIILPDADGALMKACAEGEIDIVNLSGQLSNEKGIYFEVCPPQGHNKHGRVERKIKSIQKSLDRSGMDKMRNTATGWQTIAKTVEREINSVPLGYLYHRKDGVGALLRILTPNMLKLSTYTDRSPRGMFSIPDMDSPSARIRDTYYLWYKCWTEEYLPVAADMSKWTKESKNFEANDIVLFKLTESKMSADWRTGKIDTPPRQGRDGKVREVEISYKLCNKPGLELDKDFAVVTRPARQVVKLFNIKETSLAEEIESVKRLAEDIIETKGDTLAKSSSGAGPSGPEVVTSEPESQTVPVQGELFPIKKVKKAEGQRLRDEIGVAEHLGPRRLRSSAETNTQTLQCINLPDRGNPRISPRFSYGDIYHKKDELGRGEEHGDEIQNTDHLYEAVLIV